MHLVYFPNFEHWDFFLPNKKYEENSLTIKMYQVCMLHSTSKCVTSSNCGTSLLLFIYSILKHRQQQHSFKNIRVSDENMLPSIHNTAFCNLIALCAPRLNNDHWNKSMRTWAKHRQMPPCRVITWKTATTHHTYHCHVTHITVMSHISRQCLLNHPSW